MKYVICNTINKYLSSNLTSLKSFIQTEDAGILFLEKEKGREKHGPERFAFSPMWRVTTEEEAATEATKELFAGGFVAFEPLRAWF